MKTVFAKVKDWLVRHRPSRRRLIQLYAALLYNANIKGFVTGKIYSGNTKYACLPGFNCYSCPGAVGACPLGALQNALASSNTKAPFYVFGIIILFGLLLGRVICGFLCPMGLIQDLLYKIKSPKLKKSRVTRTLSYFKYILLAAMIIIIPLAYASVNVTIPAFCKYICPVGTLEGSVSLLLHPGNADFFEMLGPVFTWKFTLMILILGGSVFVYRLFCRFICPLGALYSLFCRIAMLGIKLDKQKCVDCGLCIQTCKMDIKHVGDHECIHCGDCVKVCPTHAISWKGSKILLHANAVEDGGLNASGETVSLAAIVAGGSVQSAAAGTDAGTVSRIEIAAESVNNARDEAALAKLERARIRAAARAAKARRGTPEYVKKRNFFLEIAAWAVALAVLVTAIVYYNFIYNPVAAQKVYGVGEVYPSFTARKFFDEDPEAQYSLQDDLDAGKIVILNFWYIGCGGCEEEIPYFGRLAQDEEYKDRVSVVIVHAGDPVYGAESVMNYNGVSAPYLEIYVDMIKGWSQFSGDVTWIMDTDDETSHFLSLGGNAAYPITAILDSNGVVQYRTASAMSQSTLYSEVDRILAMQ